MKKSISFILIIFSFSAFGAAPIEKEPFSISKSYANGDYAELNCHSLKGSQCSFIFLIDGEKKKFEVSFQKLGVLPDFRDIRIYGVSKPFVVNAVIQYKCRSVDIDRLSSDTPGAYCELSGVFYESGEIEWMSPEIYPVLESIGGPPLLLDKTEQ